MVERAAQHPDFTAGALVRTRRKISSRHAQGDAGHLPDGGGNAAGTEKRRQQHDCCRDDDARQHRGDELPHRLAHVVRRLGEHHGAVDPHQVIVHRRAHGDHPTVPVDAGHAVVIAGEHPRHKCGIRASRVLRSILLRPEQQRALRVIDVDVRPAQLGCKEAVNMSNTTFPSINCVHSAESETAREVSSRAIRSVRICTDVMPASTPVSAAVSRQAHSRYSSSFRKMSLSSFRQAKLISNAIHRAHAPAALRRHLLANALDLRVHGTRIAEVIIAPHL